MKPNVVVVNTYVAIVAYDKFIKETLPLYVCRYSCTLDSRVPLNQPIDEHFVVDKK